jgi:murein DD-endopeptidase MepM/ murein hydrolase activator NlpD
MGNHRADRRGPKRAATIDPLRSHDVPATRTRAARPTAGGKRKAARRRTASTPLPSAPTLIGAVAILAAAGGAVAFGPGRLPGDANIALSAGASDSLDGTDAFGYSGNARARAISRDTDRQAKANAAGETIQQVVEEQSAQRNAKLASLAVSAEKRADQIAKNLWVLPTIGYHLTARFGQSSGLWSHNHTGLDFAAPSGNPIFAVANGVITDAGYDGAYGNKTVETLSDGTEIWYCHQSTIGVSIGEKVVQSEQIGTVGSTGNTTGPHVHIEVHPGGGDPVDPYPEFVFHGVTP